MAYYNTCPICGSNLDPGEKCDCQQEKRPERTAPAATVRRTHRSRTQKRRFDHLPIAAGFNDR